MKITARIGDRVQKGQVLALLDDRLLRSACESQKARIASAQAQIREWEAEQRMAEADLRRANSMRAEKIISEESWEHAKYRVDETIAEVARHRNDAETAEADLKTADLQLEQSRIVAPFAGSRRPQFRTSFAGSKEGRRPLLDHRGSSFAGSLHRS